MIMHKDWFNQIKTFRIFLNKKGKLLLLLIGLLILGVGSALISWYYWSNHQLNNTYKISQSYEETINSIYFDFPQMLGSAEKFIVDNKDIYGALVSLKIAKLYVDKNELDRAAIQLHQGISLIKDDSLKSLVNLRLARIQIQQKKTDDALKILSSIKEEGFSAIIADLRGEALLSKGDKQNAHKVWEIGMKSNISSVLREIIKMKIGNLSI